MRVFYAHLAMAAKFFSIYRNSSILTLLFPALAVFLSQIGLAQDQIPLNQGNSNTKFDGAPPPVPPYVVSRDDQGHITMRAIRIDEPLVLDGLLNESVYANVESVSDFIQQDPIEGVPATEQTEAWVFFDSQNLYISSRCQEIHPEKIIANELRRDQRNIYRNDTFTVVLDTFLDRRNGFQFRTNPLGALADSYITDESERNDDWNTVWDVKTNLQDRGWTLEMSIPFRSLRYRPGNPQVWGINFQRVVRHKNEVSYLTAIPQSYGGRGITKLSSAATLVGLEVPATGSNLELKPYATATLSTDRTAEPPISNDFDPDAGFDLKYGLTRSLTADLTVNTDFAQVEVDEQLVNLTRFSLFYPEKREFFLEGQGTFAFGGASAGGGRGGGGGGSGGGGGGIGGGGGPGDGLVPRLFYSRSIGLNEGQTVPILMGGRLTGKAGPFSIGALNIQTREAPEAGAEATNFSVVRIKRDIFNRSSIGFIATNRSDLPDGTGSNQVFGIDASFAFREEFTINSYIAKTWTPGLNGEDLSYRAAFDYKGDRYGLNLQHLAVGKNFTPEIGFLRREDFRGTFARLRFSPRPRSIESIRQWGVEADLAYVTDGAGLLETRNIKLTPQIDFESGDRWSLSYERNYEFLKEDFEVSDDIFIPAGGYRFQNLNTRYEFGPQHWANGDVSFERGSFYDGDRTSVGANLRLPLSYRLSLEPGLSFNWVNLPWGDFNTDLLTTRINLALSPRLSLGTLIQYNSDSNSVSTNVRFRWEYQPGSDLFVVYSEGRNTEPRGMPSLESRTLAVKFTHLFRF